MVSQVYTISVRTSSRTQLVDITRQVRELVRKSGITEGICVVYVPHTTAGVTINENADPSVREDIEDVLNRLVPPGRNYRHLEGNADSHVKSVMVGPSIDLIVTGGDILLGTWQGIFFCEFDGPRNRKVLVRVVGE